MIKDAVIQSIVSNGSDVKQVNTIMDDITVTKSTKQAFDLINIELADSIMISNEYYSMKGHGLI